MVVIMIMVLIVVVVVIMMVIVAIHVLILMVFIVLVHPVVFVGLRIKDKFFRAAFPSEFQVLKQPCISQVEPMRVFPIKFCDFMKPFYNFCVVDFDGEFPAVIKTSRRKVYRPDDGSATIREEHFTMQFQVL